MADTSWEYIIPGVGTYNDTSQDFEPVVPGVGTVNEGAAAPVGAVGLLVGGGMGLTMGSNCNLMTG